MWWGAVERFYEVGITKLGVIHRGFSTYEKTKYRNNPEWQIPIDLQNKFPDLPLILDPSHIAGRRDIIFELSQTALDLNYDGLMIETHPDPDNAWSDAEQQITPEKLVEIMRNLKVRNLEGEGIDFKNTLEMRRTQIDLIDDQIIGLLAKRMKIVDTIGELKKINNVAILQVKRWNQIMERMLLEGGQNQLSEDFVMSVFKAIHQESISHQKKVMKD